MKTFVFKLAVAVTLVLSSFSLAQDDKVLIPSVDNPTPEAAKDYGADNQASVSDQETVGGKIEQVAPIQPVEDTVANVSKAVEATSGCVGCGQSCPIFSALVVGGRCANCNSGCGSISVASNCGGCGQAQPMISSPCSTGCGSCRGCTTGCRTVRVGSCVQKIASCGCPCGQVGQVSYDQPTYQGPIVTSVPTTVVATPVSVVSGTGSIVNPIPNPTPLSICGAGCNSCGTTVATIVDPKAAYGVFGGGCSDCCRTRGRLRGRIFRNR